jgi:2,4-dienoyl-CoA reductase-like NADH-dependent reductase (Old Yellow Enzyme family)
MVQGGAAGLPPLFAETLLGLPLKAEFPESSAPEGTHADLAGRIKAAVSIPVIAVGRIQRRAVADRILEEGKADLIALGRQLLADPLINPVRRPELSWVDL